MGRQACFRSTFFWGFFQVTNDFNAIEKSSCVKFKFEIKISCYQSEEHTLSRKKIRHRFWHEQHSNASNPSWRVKRLNVVILHQCIFNELQPFFVLINPFEKCSFVVSFFVFEKIIFSTLLKLRYICRCRQFNRSKCNSSFPTGW